MPRAVLVSSAAVVAGAGAALVLVDVVVAAAVLIAGLTGVALVALVRDWDAHPSFEQRELERARRRAATRERTAGARARDRARWEAHQAKKAEQAARAPRRPSSG